jgi:hypothetical protein
MHVQTRGLTLCVSKSIEKTDLLGKEGGLPRVLKPYHEITERCMVLKKQHVMSAEI